MRFKGTNYDLGDERLFLCNSPGGTIGESGTTRKKQKGGKTIYCSQKAENPRRTREGVNDDLRGKWEKMTGGS